MPENSHHQFWDTEAQLPETDLERALQTLEVRRLYFNLFPEQIPPLLTPTIELQFTLKERKQRGEIYQCALRGFLIIDSHSKQKRDNLKFKVCPYRGVSSNGSQWKV